MEQIRTTPLVKHLPVKVEFHTLESSKLTSEKVTVFTKDKPLLHVYVNFEPN